jgi:hypothetical protein
VTSFYPLVSGLFSLDNILQYKGDCDKSKGKNNQTGKGDGDVIRRRLAIRAYDARATPLPGTKIKSKKLITEN